MYTQSEQGMRAQLGRVIAISELSRTVSVEWVSETGKQDSVYVVSMTGDYSMPAVGDVGIILEVSRNSYYIATVTRAYANLVSEVKKDSDGNIYRGKKIYGGEIAIANIVKRTWLKLSNNGDFSLLGGIAEGLKYIKSKRLFKFTSMCMRMFGNAAELGLGSALRNIPGSGWTPFPNETGSTAIEFFVNLKKATLSFARFHLGDVKDSLGVDEFGSWGARIRALLSVLTAGVPVAVLKMDETGNIELSTTTGQLMLDGLPTAGILLGGLGAAHPVIHGDTWLTWVNAHTHSTAWGPSGTPISPATNSLLSVKTLSS